MVYQKDFTPPSLATDSAHSKGLCQNSLPALLVSSVGRTWGTCGGRLGAQHHGLQSCRTLYKLLPPFAE